MKTNKCDKNNKNGDLKKVNKKNRTILEDLVFLIPLESEE